LSSLKRQGAPRGTPQQTTRLRFIWRPPYDRVVQKSSLWRPIRAKSCMAGAIRRRIGRRKTKEGKHEGEKVARRWSGRAGETKQARGRPTSERESKRGIGSRSSLARAAAFPPAAVGSCRLPARSRSMQPCPLPPQEQLPPLVKFREEQPPANRGHLPIGAGLQERGEQETERGIWERVAAALRREELERYEDVRGTWAAGGLGQTTSYSSSVLFSFFLFCFSSPFTAQSCCFKFSLNC